MAIAGPQLSQKLLDEAAKNTATINQHTETIVGTWDLQSTSAKAPAAESCVSLRYKLPGKENVVGRDDRQRVPAADFSTSTGKYRGVVKLFCHFENMGEDFDEHTWSHGTGWLIAPDLIVTAGHCAYEWSNNLGRLDKVKIYLGYEGRESIGRPSVQFREGKRVAAPAEWLKGPTGPTQRAPQAYDAAFIIVDRPFEGVQPIKYENTPEKDTAMIGVVGYPGDLEHGEYMYQHFMQTSFDLAVAGRMLTYKIDTAGGQSGSPVFRQDRMASIGIHTYGGDVNQATVIGPLGNIFTDYVMAVRSPIGDKTTNGIHFFSIAPHGAYASEITSTSNGNGTSFNSTGFQPVTPQPQPSGFQPIQQTGFQPQPTNNWQNNPFLPQPSADPGFSQDAYPKYQPQPSNSFSQGGFQPQPSNGFSQGGFQPQPSNGFSQGEFQPQPSNGFPQGGSQPQTNGSSQQHGYQPPQNGGFQSNGSYQNGHQSIGTADASFSDLVKTANDPFQRFGEVAAPIAAVANVSMAVAGHLASQQNSGTESTTDQASLVRGLAGRAIMGEAALQAFGALPPGALQEEGFIDFLAGTAKTLSPIFKKAGPIIMKKILPSALKMTADAFQKSARPATESAGFEWPTTTESGFVPHGNASQNESYPNSNTAEFAQELISELNHSENAPEGFFDFIGAAVGFINPLAGMAITNGLPLLVDGISKLVSTESAFDHPDESYMNGMSERAVLQEAALSAVLSRPPAALPEGFIDFMKDKIRQIGPVVLREVPKIIKAVTPLVKQIAAPDAKARGPAAGPKKGANLAVGNGRPALGKKRSQLLKHAGEKTGVVTL